MSAAFTDIEALARLARAEVDGNVDYLQRWYEQKFERTDDAYEDRSAAYWNLCMLRDLWHRRGQMMAEMHAVSAAAAKSKQAQRARDQLIVDINGIHQAFSLPPVYADPVSAKWDAMLAKGKMPDLNRR